MSTAISLFACCEVLQGIYQSSGRSSRSSSHCHCPQCICIELIPAALYTCLSPSPGTRFPIQHPPRHVKNCRAQIRPRFRMTDSYALGTRFRMTDSDIHKKGTATIPTLERQRQDKEVKIASATYRVMSQKAQREIRNPKQEHA